MKDTMPGERVPTGWPYVRSLTPREVTVMEHVLQGYTSNEIAVALGIAPQTVTSHLGTIRVKLQVIGKNRNALIAAYLATRETQQ